MAGLLARRLAIMLPTLAGVTLLLFAITSVTPGAPTAPSGERALSAELAAAIGRWDAERFVFDAPLHRRFMMWMSRVVSTDDGAPALGESMLTGRSVRAELRDRLPVTFALSALALMLAFIVAAPAGLVMALRAGGVFDRAIFGVLLTLWSVPMVVMATLLLAFATRGGSGVAWFPSAGGGDASGAVAALWRLTLPAICLAIVACAPLARQFRAALLEQLGQEFVQTALAKGLSRGAVVRRHVLRAALGPVVTVMAMLIPRLIAGSVIVETVFSIDGMGRLAWRSAVNRDLDVVLMIALISAIAHMVSLLVADVLVMMLDPRVRISAARKAGGA